MVVTTITLKDKLTFKRRVIEIYDPIHLQRYWYVKVKSSKEFDNVLNKIIPNYSEKVEVSIDEEDNDGESIDLVLDGQLVIIFWCNTSSINSIVHESLHAILFCAKSRGIKLENDESLCYMLGFLVSEVCRGLKLELKNKSS